MVTVGNVCRPPGICTPFWPYQSLPDLTHGWRNPLVILVWSGGGLPTVTMAVDVPDDPFWLVWILLPSLTNLRIWVKACRRVPLPTFTTATKGLHIDRSVVASIGHRLGGWARVITVDNSGGPSAHSERVTRWVVGVTKKIFFQSGRSASKFIPMVVKLVGQ